MNFNQMIKSPQVRVIAEDGEQLGILDIDEALAKAREAGQDLVEVAPEAKPPVCRIMDFGRFKYLQSKRQSESRKKSNAVETKEIKFRPKTAEHDYQFKVRNIKKFLEEHNKIKVSLVFKGREIAHTEVGQELMNRLVAEISEFAHIEQSPNLEGRTMVMVISPK
ncbi:MAG: translation initiation factor IF-3 [Deltaproteobacteria bacterium]|jgi:translation initiation factor IF-3|nr:translation initiation factor IF-3 [Deltaproteobacteria bacterium]